jgi:hypothetical protein
VIANETYVEVRKHGSPERFAATVLQTANDCDLAMLTVEDESFWDPNPEDVAQGAGAPLALSFGELPELRSKVVRVLSARACLWRGLTERNHAPSKTSQVAVYGYPTGGDTLCITSGVVSRAEMQQYAHQGGGRLLALQIDAAINPVTVRAWKALHATSTCHTARAPRNSERN